MEFLAPWTSISKIQDQPKNKGKEVGGLSGTPWSGLKNFFLETALALLSIPKKVSRTSSSWHPSPNNMTATSPGLHCDSSDIFKNSIAQPQSGPTSPTDPKMSLHHCSYATVCFFRDIFCAILIIFTTKISKRDKVKSKICNIYRVPQ